MLLFYNLKMKLCNSVSNLDLLCRICSPKVYCYLCQYLHQILQQ